MVGEGLKQEVYLSDNRITKIQHLKTKLKVSYQNKYGKVITIFWVIENNLSNGVLCALGDSSYFFSEEKKGNLVFECAQLEKDASSLNYGELEHEVHYESSLPENFLLELTEKGKRYLEFDKFLETKNT